MPGSSVRPALLAPAALVAAAAAFLPAAAASAAPAGTDARRPALAQGTAPGPKPGGRPSAFGELGSNREPIKIDADRLDVFDKEGRAVFAGNVVAVQGESTMRCTQLTVHYEGGRAAAAAAGSAAGNAAGNAGGNAGGAPSPKRDGNPMAGGDSAIRKIDCRGPVTIVSKTQVATGDNAEFDRARNKVLLVGNAALSDGANVTRGERVAYDINTGVANVEGGGGGGRVRALIVPGSQSGQGGKDAARPR